MRYLICITSLKIKWIKVRYFPNFIWAPMCKQFCHIRASFISEVDSHSFLKSAGRVNQLTVLSFNARAAYFTTGRSQKLVPTTK